MSTSSGAFFMISRVLVNRRQCSVSGLYPDKAVLGIFFIRSRAVFVGGG
jgi:hypothetical protein